MQSLLNKVVVITGASSGIGRSTAVEAAKRGAKLVLAARNYAALEETAAMCMPSAQGISLFKADISLEADCKVLIQHSIDVFGQIDVLINNAGISMRALFLETDLAVIKKVMDINFWGTVYCTKYALPHLLKSHGSVVGVSSIAGRKGLPGRTGYSASKFAMQGFLEALRIEHLHDGLHVLMAFPGFTASNIRQTALSSDGSQQGESPREEGKMMQSSIVAEHLLNAVEKRKRTLTLTAQGKMTVWLNKFFPGIVDRMVFNHMANEPDAPIKKR